MRDRGDPESGNEGNMGRVFGNEDGRDAGPYILPIDGHAPARVPFGLIHAWLGAGFVPNATIADILKVVRDYIRNDLQCCLMVASCSWASCWLIGYLLAPIAGHSHS